MADGNITKDAMYGAVAPDDFESMLTLDRYGERSTAFDKIISATHDHFWDPLDKRYIDFDEPFDLVNEAMTPEEQNPILRLPYMAETLKDPLQRVAFITVGVIFLLGATSITSIVSSPVFLGQRVRPIIPVVIDKLG